MRAKGIGNKLRIVEAANELFYHQGYNQTSFSDIAEAAGIPRGNFYYYFKTKEDILGAVVEKRMQDIRGQFPDWERQCPDPKARLRRYIDVLINEQEAIARYGCPMGSLNVELCKTQLDLQSQAGRMFDLFKEWLKAQFEALGYKEDAERMALHLIAWNQGVAVITNAYSDPEFLRWEANALKHWIDSL